MTIKQYTAARLITAASLAAIVSQAVVLKNYYLAAAAVVIGVLLLMYVKKQVTEVTADERDYKIAGDSARWSLIIFSILGAIGSFILLTARAYNPALEAAGSTLAYSVCLLLLVNSFVNYFLRYRQSEISTGKKISLALAAILLAALFAVLGIRLFSGEDGWICQNGQWVAHGHPSSPLPERACR
ncbi:MAG: DUF2178 domain-containing protein [Candidatus Doudnabacteria bacterium]|nr:DUF2178 domain-containing protein [Candidatus Doudnabacteria bacterium]